MRTCDFPGCNRLHFGKGFCRGHYEQIREGRTVTQLRHQRRRGTQPEIGYMEQPCLIFGLDGPCHVFSGYVSRKGYGQIHHSGKVVPVHRYCWELIYGLIPDDMVIDHQCRNRACCNIEHLRLVTRKVNSTENVVGICWQLHKAKTHCPQGHAYDDNNTYFYKNERQCRTCRRERQRIKRS